MISKKIIVFFIFLLVSVRSFTQIYEGRAAKSIVPNAKTVQLDEHTSVPTFLVFEEAEQLSTTEFPDWERKAFQYEEGLTFSVRKTVEGKNGMTHEFRDQYYHGIPIDNALSVLHYKDDKIIYVNGNLHHYIGINTNPRVSADAVVRKVLAEYGIPLADWQRVISEQQDAANNKDHSHDNELENTLVVYPQEGKYLLAWKSRLISPHFDTYKDIYTDAQTGEIIQTHSALLQCDEGTALTTYRGNQTIWTDQVNGRFILHNDCGPANIRTTFSDLGSDYVDDDNVWNGSGDYAAAYTAHFGVTGAFDYFKNTHGQLGVDGGQDIGGAVTATVNVNILYNSNNAFYVRGSRTLQFGAGSANVGTDDLTTPDICGHEFTHGVLWLTGGITDYSANRETSALHEGIADIFGNQVEAFIDGVGPEWIVGEELDDFDGRLLDNPNGDGSPDTYLGDFWTGSSRHQAGGVVRFWFYLLSEGGEGVNDNDDNYDVEGVSNATAAEILYEAISSGSFGASPTYYTARNATIQAAITLFGPCSSELKSVMDAWYAVGVGDAFPQPDIRVDDLQIVTSSSVPAGGALGVVYNLTANAGVRPATTSVGFYLLPTCPFLWLEGQYIPFSVQVGQVECSATRINGANLTLPADTPPGEYFLVIRADDDHSLAETSEFNNTFCANITVTPIPRELPDFVLQAPTVNLLEVPSGTSFETSVDLLNQGDIYGGSTITCYYLSTNTTYSTDDIFLGNKYSNGLFAGSSVTKTTTLTIPSGTSSGNYYIVYKADCYDWRLESDENNNTTYAPITVPAVEGESPDLLIENVNPSIATGLPPVLMLWQNLTVEYDLVNLYPNIGPGPSATRIYLSTDEEVSSDDILVGTYDNQYPGSKTAVFPIPGNAALNQYYQILIVADYFGDIVELNEDNNVGVGHVIVAPGFSGSTSTKEYLSFRDELTSEVTVKIFPNPTQDQFTIDYVVQEEPITITLLNSTGRQMADYSLSASEQTGKWQYQGEQLPAGLYYIQWQSHEDIKLLKLIVE